MKLMDHPNVVKLVEHFETSTSSVLVMKYSGENNLSAYSEKKLLSQSDYSTIAKQLLEGLDYIHGKRVIHGDIKLENVVVSSQHEGSISIVIIDFGLSRKLEQPGEVFLVETNLLGNSWHTYVLIT